MLGILLLYFIWKYYSELAFQHGKSKWGFALLGIASYYGGTFVGAFLIGAIGALINPSFIDDTSDIAISFMALPIGLLSVWGLYRYLKSRWGKKAKSESSDALDSDLIQ